MHVAIDTTPLTTGHSGRGVGVYTRKLLEALHAVGGKHTYSAFSQRDGLPKGIDLVHYPYFDPFFRTLPFRSPVPLVVTVHDLIPLVFPKHFPRGIRGSIKWRLQKYALRRAVHIITDSEASKRDVVRFAGIPKKKVTAIHLAPAIESRNAAVLPSVLPENFFMYVGDLNWNKNVSGLLEAFAQVKKAKKNVRLMLVGSAFQNAELPEAHAVSAAIESLKLGESVHRVGRLTEEELCAAYAQAIACVQPSFYEGFGLPVLEAFACGCPVVCATGSSLDEIAGPAIRVDPADTKSIADGMMQAMSLPARTRAELISRGTDWVKKFTWDETARQTIAVYEDVISHNSGL